MSRAAEAGAALRSPRAPSGAQTGETPTGETPPGETQNSGAPPLRSLTIIGGGTGGHLTPGLSVAERALDRFPGSRVFFFRTRRAVEGQVFAAARPEIEVEELDISPPGRSPVSWMRFLAQAFRAAVRISAELRRRRPDALLALGGYPCVPGLWAARRQRVPIVLLEQNQTPGRVVRWFSRWADAVACAGETARIRLPRGAARDRAVVTGNPLRRSVLDAAASRALRRIERRTQGPQRRSEMRQVVVVGGSQGARSINRAIESSLEGLASYRSRILWTHITGIADKDRMVEVYRRNGWDARVFAYAPDLPALLADADLVIARAGGTTVAELAAIGAPAVLVPYPHHSDRHQLHNALSLVDAGAARLLPEESMGPEEIRGIVAGLLFDDASLDAMEDAALRVARPDAADRVLDLVMSLKGEA